MTPSFDLSAKNKKKIIIIGAGNLGTSFYQVLSNIYPRLILLIGRQPLNHFCADQITAKDYNHVFSKSYIDDVQIIFIAVQDDKIYKAAEELSKFNLSNKLIFHMSGARDAAELDILKKAGASVASLHPLQTFPEPFCSTQVWREIYWSFQGEEKCYTAAVELTQKLNGRLLKLNAEQKRALHIAGIFVANYLVGLLSVSESVLANAGIHSEAANSILQPLLQGVTSNYKSAKASEILSGPLKRGDTAIIEKHLTYLKENNGPVELYTLLAKVIVTNNDFKITDREKLLELLEKLPD